jgi:hypothetical protein
MCYDPLMSCLGSVLWSLLYYLFGDLSSVSLSRCLFYLLFLFCLSSRLSLAVCQSQSHIATDGQSVSKSWYRAQDIYFCLTVTFLFPWGALSDERTGLSLVSAAGPCQRSLFRVLVPWDLRTYFTVSDLRRPFSSPPTTRRVTVEEFDPATHGCWLSVLSVAPQIQCLRLE